MKIITTTHPVFRKEMKRVGERRVRLDGAVEKKVKLILKNVRERGDRALFEYTKKFDHFNLRTKNLKIGAEEIEKAVSHIQKETVDSFTLAASRIREFHQKEFDRSWILCQGEGEVLGQMVRPLEKIGVYVPGGKASYPSSLLMNVIPAQVAGVKEIVVVSPTPGGEVNPYLLLAAKIAGVSCIYRIGGAQAVGALAYGTRSIARVDKIVGPGNVYVATAKRLVFGEVDIDMIAGPSEILILSDGTGSPAFIAADLLSQAEHDEMALPMLITTSAVFAREVAREVSCQLDEMKERKIAAVSIKKQGLIIVVKEMKEAIDLANEIAPEHLELAVERPWELLGAVQNAGAVFLGHYTPEAVGDYIAGPNHTLPTGGTARFFSPLSVNDFLKKTSFISFSREALGRVGKKVIQCAEKEGLKAHARAVEVRLKGI